MRRGSPAAGMRRKLGAEEMGQGAKGRTVPEVQVGTRGGAEPVKFAKGWV